MDKLKKYRRYVLLLFCIIFLSYIGLFSDPLPNVFQKISAGTFFISLILCLVIVTMGVIKFSQKIGKLAYFLVIISILGAIFAFSIHTIDLIELIALYTYYISLLASLIAGVVAIVKEEKGLAKLSGFILLLCIGMIIVCTYIAYNISNGGF
ncbi:hypothetical protein [Gottfriedia solisilvae]|uniref:hypothetical protein n=1 Tax=Gottfriedia solisilvae TaxID=1516104 RepID=UPI003D2EA8BA